MKRSIPSFTAKILAQLSVLPAMIYSPLGLHARSYTCMVVHLSRIVVKTSLERSYETYRNVVLGFQCSFSYCRSS